MNVCEQCGKAMATRGGLEIHMELAHGAPKAPTAMPVGVGPIPATPHGAVPQRTIAIPRAPATEWRLPDFLRGIDATVPLTALLVIVLFLAGAVAAVHRSSSGAPSAASLQGGAPGAAAPAVPVDPAVDRKLAQSLVLTQIDYPDGWKVTPHVTSASDVEDTRLEATCLALPDPATTHSAEVAGMDAESELLQATSDVTVFRTQEQAASDFAAQGGPRADACAKQELTRGLAADGITVRDVGVGRFALSTGNVHSIALHAEIAASKGAASGVIHTDVVFLQQGRVEGAALFISNSGEVPADIEQTVVTRFAHKVAGA